MAECLLYNLGRSAYHDALELQFSLVARCQAGDFPAALITVEHEPVITMGAGAKESNILLSETRLNELGVSLARIDRGGDVTYHGPGQIVAYPIFNLRALGLDAHGYLRGLESVVIRALEKYGLEGSRHGPAGVWVGEKKVCSIGVAIRRSVTYHGLAFNVSPNMAHFAYINPCGLAAAQITCLAELIEPPPAMPEVEAELLRNFAEVFNVRLRGGMILGL
ncbi:MAG: lipoyl(octanoyl) transferase LipB [Armatimonadota bacterium]|nr:lipoyl(octanoyl) transferase LipB [Armatimonadota bacterium]